jgi:hypothetical protein
MTIEDDLPFKIERWSEGYGRPEETIAMAGDLLSAKAAFEAAVKRRPGESIRFRAQSARCPEVINDNSSSLHGILGPTVGHPQVSQT